MDGTTAATIPIRDANGRMQAADPASGATDKTLVTANWVSQTGAGAPNNLLHTTGNESKSGVITFASPQEGTWEGHRLTFATTTGGQWYKIGEIINRTVAYTSQSMTWIISSNYYNASKGGVALFHLIIPNATVMDGFIPIHDAVLSDIWSNFAIKIGKKADGTIEVFAKGRDYTAYQFNPISILYTYGNLSPNDTIIRISATVVPEPQAADYVQLLTVTI